MNGGVPIVIFGRFQKTGQLFAACGIPRQHYKARSQMTTMNGSLCIVAFERFDKT